MSLVFESLRVRQNVKVNAVHQMATCHVGALRVSLVSKRPRISLLTRVHSPVSTADYKAEDEVAWLKTTVTKVLAKWKFKLEFQR